MNTTPDPAFVEHLEWQLRTAHRRRGRFARPTPGLPTRAVRTGLLVLVCLFGGAGVVVAAERIQDDARREHLVAKHEIQVEMARLRLEHATVEYARTQELVEQGLIGNDQLGDDRQRLVDLKTSVEQAELDLREVQQTGQAPRRDLTAPLVGGEDFVSLRLALEVERAKAGVDREFARLERTRTLVDAGVVTRQELAGEEAEILLRLEQIAELEERIGLRRAFLAGELTADQIELREQVLAAQRAVAKQRIVLDGLQERLDVTRRLEERGFVRGEVLELELQLRLAMSELKLAELELAALEARREDR